MITPSFTIDQDDEFIFIKVKISNIRFSAQSIEMIADDNLFIFALNPYYLRLRLPGSLIDDERSHAEYVSKEECVDIKVPKLNKGENFPDLDLTAKLLARVNEDTLSQSTSTPNESLNFLNGGSNETSRGAAVGKSLIQELDVNNGTVHEKNLQDAEMYNWEVEQSLPQSSSEGIHIGSTSSALPSAYYGFNNQYSNMIAVSVSNGNDINELSSPDTMSGDDRVIERMIKENIKFDPEYYANDYLSLKYMLEDEGAALKEILDWKCEWKSKFIKWTKSKGEDEDHLPVEFTKEEQDRMNQLPRKTYLIDDPRPIYYTIVSLLFSYALDMRETEGDHNVESPWTIGKITPQISCLDSQFIQSNNLTEKNMIKIIVLTLSRRALCFPLHRHFDLIQKVWEDVYFMLRCGKRTVLKCIMDLRELFRFHDVYYIYCKVLLDDLCSWILSDSCSEAVLRNLAHEVKKESAICDRKAIIFEKIMNPTVDLDEAMENVNEEANEDEDLEVINLEDVEELAEGAYLSAQEQ